jgi:hypothetical protein
VSTDQPSPTDQLIGDLQQHLASRSLRETAQEQENKYKKRLLDDLVEVGEETPEGHYVFTFDNGAPFQLAGDRAVRSVKREKRAPLTLDPDKVDKLLAPEHFDAVYRHTITLPGLSEAEHKAVMDAIRSTGLIGAVEEETTIDEDALLSLNYEEQISDADLKAMYSEPEKPVFALKVSYAK